MKTLKGVAAVIAFWAVIILGLVNLKLLLTLILIVLMILGTCMVYYMATDWDIYS